MMSQLLGREEIGNQCGTPRANALSLCPSIMEGLPWAKTTVSLGFQMTATQATT